MNKSVTEPQQRPSPSEPADIAQRVFRQSLKSRAVGVMLIVNGGGTLLSIILLVLTASGGGGTSHSPPIVYGPGSLPTQFTINLTLLSLPAVKIVFGLMLIFFSRAAGHYLIKGLSEKDADTCL